MTADIEKQITGSIADRLFENVSKVKYGQISVSLKVHSGRIVDITHTVTESMREPETKKPESNQGLHERHNFHE